MENKRNTSKEKKKNNKGFPYKNLERRKSKDKSIDKTDFKIILLAHIGNFFLTIWCIWSYSVYGIVGTDLSGFLMWGLGLG